MPLVDNQWYLRVNREANESGLTRNISYFINHSDEIFKNSIIMSFRYRRLVLNLKNLYGSQNVNIQPEVDSFLNCKKTFRDF